MYKGRVLVCVCVCHGGVGDGGDYVARWLHVNGGCVRWLHVHGGYTYGGYVQEMVVTPCLLSHLGDADEHRPKENAMHPKHIDAQD